MKITDLKSKYESIPAERYPMRWLCESGIADGSGTDASGRDACGTDGCETRTGRRVVHIAGLGDVGRTLAAALTLLGGDRIERIGLYDLSPAQCGRMQRELGQISYPGGSRRTPEVVVAEADRLFDCDVFLFCATKAVPEVGSGVRDVRMAQYEANRPIVSAYARQAAQAGYTGLFGVVSDPVELLCMAALQASREAAGEPGQKKDCPGIKGPESGSTAKGPESGSAAKGPEGGSSAKGQPAHTGAGLHPYQIQGFGMGVMYARAAYYAKELTRRAETSAAMQRERAGRLTCCPASDIAAEALLRHLTDESMANAGPYAYFAREGRVYGQHGAFLTAANSTVPAHYDDTASRHLTALALQANKEVRDFGFKPYIAPALSSAALTVLAVLGGEWNDSAVYLGGLYFGARNRTLADRYEWEDSPLPEDLSVRIEAAYREIDTLEHGVSGK